SVVRRREQLGAARHSLGLDRRLYAQYRGWMADGGGGTLGGSFGPREHISDLILRRGPITAEIAVLALVVSWLAGVPLGIASTTHRDSGLDFLTRGTITVFLAIPSFWIGLVIVLVGVLVFTWRPPLTISYL